MTFGCRSPLVAKLIFLEQLCDISEYLPRSTLENHVPYTILRSIYQLYYENTVPALMLTGARRQGFGIGTSQVALGTGSVMDGNGDVNGGFSSFRGGTPRTAGKSSTPRKHGGHGVRFSGPLDYSGGRKVSFTEGIAAGTARSGPLT